jgi:5-methylcytosine-specific restriction endonuclease McrA
MTMFEYRPVPKPVKESKDKPRRKGKAKIPKKRKKKLEVYKGRTIPSAKTRGQISKREYERMIEEFGSVCIICGNPYIEAHHVKFRSSGGRGKWRNLVPLCKEHHMKAHSDRKFADWLREEREKRFGPWYWADEYDLFKAGLIPNTTKEAFEKYMEGEENERLLKRQAEL